MEQKFTTDDFLGGLLKLSQPVNGYRATSDAVLLAAAITPKSGQKVLDIGTGTGAVGLCLLARCPEITVAGLEIQTEMTQLARNNAALNGYEGRFNVVSGDIRSRRIDGLQTGSFDWVITNPPFILEDQVSPDKIRDIAHRESDCSLKEWIENGLRYVSARGYFALINRADRLAEILSIIFGRLGGIRLIPVWTKEGEPAKRIILIGRKGSRSPTVLEPGITLMSSNGERTPQAESIMRQGTALY